MFRRPLYSNSHPASGILGTFKKQPTPVTPPQPKPVTKMKNKNGLTMREAINAGLYWRVSIPAWASGGMDVIAESASDAALHVGCMLESFGGASRPDASMVHRHLRNSSIGCAMLDEGHAFQTLTAEHYSI